MILHQGCFKYLACKGRRWDRLSCTRIHTHILGHCQLHWDLTP